MKEHLWFFYKYGGTIRGICPLLSTSMVQLSLKELRPLFKLVGDRKSFRSKGKHAYFLLNMYEI